MRILSVDDDDDNLFLVARTAQSRNYEVVSAHNGIEALEQLEAGSFELIVSDILMPGMDGFRFCRAVKDDARFRSIPFIFYTATYTAKEDEELAVALGASRFVVKPAGRDEFLAIIEEVVKEGAAGNIPVPSVDADDGGKSLTLYNERLVRKLERKIEQLESTRDELYRSEEQLRLMWDASMDGMVLCDEDGVILRTNRAFAEMIGTPAESLAGQTVPLCYDEAGDSVLAPGRDLIRSGAFETRCEGVLDSPERAAVHVEVSRTVVGLPSGPRALFSVVRDVTARLRLEHEQAVLRNQLHHAQKLEAVGKVAGSVAHDFNNLLTVINGYSELLSTRIPQEDPSRSVVEQIRLAGQRAADLTRRLLGFTRRQPVRPKALELNRVVDEAMPLLTRLVGENIFLSTSYLAQPVVYADALQLEQVLMNLAVNARDAMPEGGNLRIETDLAGRRQSEETASGTSGSVWAVLTIRDDGEGITEEALPHIFEPFYTSKNPEKGTGLGLSIVESIVKQTGGRIEIESSPGHGATFRVYMPAMEATAETGPQPAKAAVTDRESGDETVMVVEDQDWVRGYVEQALLAHGYHVVTASGVNDAMRIVQSGQQRPDIVLTDVVMPDGNGIDLADRIQDHWAGIPVLLMSGYAENAREIGGLKPPVPFEFIQKPFSPNQVAAKIREVLGRRDRRAAAGES
jgi:two-component system, cell cycle sensor histidine kinase and response regulator CckA